MDIARIQALLAIGEDESRAGAEDARLAPLSALARQMGDPAPSRDSPPREVMARLGDNWSSLILLVLATGVYRHATLKRVIGNLSAEGDISQRMLTLRLRALERDGFVARIKHGTVPPRVEYTLTRLGQDLVDSYRGLLVWIDDNTAEILAARSRFSD